MAVFSHQVGILIRLCRFALTTASVGYLGVLQAIYGDLWKYCKFGVHRLMANISEISKRLPRCEVTKLLETFKSFQVEVSDAELREVLTKLRYENKICHFCLKKGKNVRFVACPTCRLVFYCSVQCLSRDMKTHPTWCCKPEAPPCCSWNASRKFCPHASTLLEINK